MAGTDVEPLPQDGFCLSAFLVLSPRQEPDSILVGRIRPLADGWRRAGALWGERAVKTGQAWMLPASHLELFEAPEAAAVRIAKEQLGLADFRPGPPTIVSETYHRPKATTSDPHWDLHFIFRSDVDRRPPGSAELWETLEFVSSAQLAPTDLARSHADILVFAGHALRGTTSR